MDNLWLKPVEKLRIVDMKKMLKELGSFNCLKDKQTYIKKINHYKNNINFPWRSDQQKVIDEFMLFNKKNYVIHSLFGGGKTTLLLGLLIRGILTKLFVPDEVLFLSYNISIKNEIKRKLKEYGISSKVTVRTFDSLVYEIAKVGGYQYIDLPNFEGKRKFVHELVFNSEFLDKPSFQPKVIIIDECQDLEIHSLVILNHFYPNSKFVFAGDIFQSIQKETRESILWYFMMLPEQPDTYKIYMSDTPRVPINTLNTIKTALSIHYPEFKDKITSWTSSNTISNADIEWRRLNSYTHIFDELKTFLSTHSPKETMILTFSSAITVNGNMGDIARLRRFFSENGIDVNTNHKKMDPDKYFLTTSNSSKGLERDYVIVFLTFPLENAFVHLSDDIVVNLITVALTRAKKKVIMFVPSFEDKYSRALSLFENCPKPNKTKINDVKSLKEFTFEDYINIEHDVTQLIRASVIKYDTRIKIRENIKKFHSSKIFDDNIGYKTEPIATEEDRAFVGILIENLITSTWINKWPFEKNIDSVEKNPMYIHIIKKIKNAINKYKNFSSSNIFNDRNQFDGIMLYSQLHVALSNKIFVKLSDSLTNNLRNYWIKLKPKAIEMKPFGDKLKIQVPLQMPLLKGIADAITLDSDEKTTSIYEIKASSSYDWEDNANIQIVCYALMTGKSWSRIHILNPFRNEKISYYFDTKNILTLRMQITQDILLYNINSMMAKLYPTTSDNVRLDVSETLFVNVKKNNIGEIIQVSIINMISPIKCEYVYNKYVSSNDKKTKKMNKSEKFSCESDISSDELINEVEDILSSNLNKNKTLWSFESYDEFKFKTKSIKDEYNIDDFSELIKKLKYENVMIDLNDSFVQNILCISYMFLNNRFV
jgi:hypothetical protein